MSPLHVETPLWDSEPLSRAAGVPVRLKVEALQPTRSFKIRGLGRACEESVTAGARTLVASSGGNAGYAVAHAGRALGRDVTVFVPGSTPELMRELLRAEGATVIEHGASWDDAHARAVEVARAEDAAYLHPFDDPRIWAGHATLVHELHAASARPGVLVVSVGGGGLLCGVLQGLHEVGWSDVPVVTAETHGADSFARSVAAGERVTLERIESIATTLGARTVAAEALAWTGRHAIETRVVSDRDAVQACARFARDHDLLVEPACGAALALAYDPEQPLARFGSVEIVVCGGACVSPALLEEWQRRTA